MKPVLTQETIHELEELNRKEPARFVKFYNAVFKLLSGMPENSYITIAKICRPENIDLFCKFAMFAMGDLAPRYPGADYYEFNDDMTEIHHKPAIRTQAATGRKEKP